MALFRLVHVLKRALPLLFIGKYLAATMLVVAAHPNFPLDHLDPITIKKLYLEQQHLIFHVRPLKLTLSYRDPLRNCFEKRVLQMSKDELQLYWLKTRYLGFRPPKVLSSPKAMALYLQKVPNAIGYLPLSVAKQYGLKILYQWNCNDENSN